MIAAIYQNSHIWDIQQIKEVEIHCKIIELVFPFQMSLEKMKLIEEARLSLRNKGKLYISAQDGVSLNL
jgi:hypothetical protein